MLVLNRKTNERLVITGPCVIEICHLTANRVRLGIIAEPSVNIRRAEIPDNRPTTAASINP